MGEWYTTFASEYSEIQFLIGVAALIFGSRAVLSEKNLKGKLWGLGAPARWWNKRQQDAAEEEVSEIKRLREEVAMQHLYIVWITGLLRKIEIWAADGGHTLPPPPFITYIEWKEENDKKA